MKKRFYVLTPEELEVYIAYLYDILLRKASSELAIYICFNHLMFAYNPLLDKLASLPIATSFFFGD